VTPVVLANKGGLRVELLLGYGVLLEQRLVASVDPALASSAWVARHLAFGLGELHL